MLEDILVSAEGAGWSRRAFASRPTRRRPQSPRRLRHPRLRLGKDGNTKHIFDKRKSKKIETLSARCRRDTRVKTMSSAFFLFLSEFCV